MYGYGMFLSTNGIIASSVGGLTARTTAFKNATGITDLTILNALNTLDLGLISNGLDTKMKALYPVVGGDATKHSYNFMNTAQYQLSFSSGWTHSSTGMTSNGSSAYANTGINPSTVLTTMNSGISLYNRTTGYRTGFDAGTIDGSNEYYGHINYSSSYPTGNTIQGSRFLYTSGSNDVGLITFNRTANNLANTWIKGTKVATSTATSTLGLANANIYIGAINWVAFGGATYFVNRQFSLVSIHDGLNDTQASQLNTLVQAFQTSLSRQM